MPVFTFSHYKSSCHSNQSYYPFGTKYLFVPPANRCYMRNLVRIGSMATEEMSFENVDRRRTEDGCLPILQAHL